MGDPFPQQTPGLSGDQQTGQQSGQTQPDPSLDVNTYLTGLKSAYIQIVTSQSSTCYRCHSAEKFATDGGNIDLSDINKIDSNLAEKIFFEVYTGNMPKGGPPLQKVQYDILSDYAFLLKNYPQSQVSQPQVNQPVPVSPPQ